MNEERKPNEQMTDISLEEMSHIVGGCPSAGQKARMKEG